MKCTHATSYLNLDLICVKINHNWCNFNSCWLRGTKLCLSHDLGSHSICSLVAHPLVFLYNKKKKEESPYSGCLNSCIITSWLYFVATVLQ